MSDSSLPTDRLSKAAIDAAAGVPQYLIVNLPGDRLGSVSPRVVALVALPGLALPVDAMLPRR